MSLCETHYQHMYHQTHKHMQDVEHTQILDKPEGSYFRHSPDAITCLNTCLIQQEFNTSRHCMQILIYDIHSVILNQIEEQAHGSYR